MKQQFHFIILLKMSLRHYSFASIAEKWIFKETNEFYVYILAWSRYFLYHFIKVCIDDWIVHGKWDCVFFFALHYGKSENENKSTFCFFIWITQPSVWSDVFALQFIFITAFHDGFIYSKRTLHDGSEFRHVVYLHTESHY